VSGLFVFTAGNPDAQEHLHDSIRTPIPLEKVLPYVDGEVRSDFGNRVKRAASMPGEQSPGAEHSPLGGDASRRLGAGSPQWRLPLRGTRYGKGG